MEYVTLNEFIEELKKLAEHHGNEQLMSIGKGCGDFNGIRNPFTVMFRSPNEKTYYIPAFKSDLPKK